MEIENAIILALSESRNFSNLYTEARIVRKQNGETLSRDSFNSALKRLFDDKIVNKKQISGREVLYFLNLEKSALVNNVIYIINVIDDQISWVEKFTKFVERKAEEIDDGRKQLREMGMEFTIKEDKLHLFVVREYQKLAMNLIRLTLSMQKASFFFTSKIWNINFTRKDQLKQQKQYSNIIDRLVDAIQKLDAKSAGTIHTIIRKELAQELLVYDIDMKRAEKLINNPKGLFYESLS